MHKQFYSIISLTLIYILFTNFSLYAKEGIENIIFKELTDSNSVETEDAIVKIKKDKIKSIIPLLKKAILDEDYEEKHKILINTLLLFPRKNQFNIWTDILKKSDDIKVINRIIDILSQSPHDRRIVIPLSNLLKSPFQSVRKNSAASLKKNGDDRMYPYIIMLFEDKNPVHKIYAIEAMHYLYDKRFYYIITESIKSKNKSLRIYSMSCISKNNLKEALHFIRNISMKDENIEARIKAVKVIGEMHDKRSLYILHKILNENELNLRIESAKSLIKIKSKKSAHAVSNRLYKESNDEMKSLLMNILIEIEKGGNLKALEKVILSDKNSRLRVQAAFTLGVIGENRAAGILIKAFKDKNFKVKAEIAASLGLYKNRTNINFLFSIIKNEKIRYVRSAALYSINKTGSKKTIIPLFKIYSKEKDPVFRGQIKKILLKYLKKYI